MVNSPRAAVEAVLHDAVTFVTITLVWTVVTLLFYGVFLVTKPSGVSYEPWVFASVFVVPGIGFIGHVLKQAIHG